MTAFIGRWWDRLGSADQWLKAGDHNIGPVLATACIIGYSLHASWFDKLAMRTLILSLSKDDASVGHPRNV
jgi:hypothetical protein